LGRQSNRKEKIKGSEGGRGGPSVKSNALEFRIKEKLTLSATETCSKGNKRKIRHTIECMIRGTPNKVKAGGYLKRKNRIILITT